MQLVSAKARIWTQTVRLESFSDPLWNTDYIPKAGTTARQVRHLSWVQNLRWHAHTHTHTPISDQVNVIFLKIRINSIMNKILDRIRPLCGLALFLVLSLFKILCLRQGPHSSHTPHPSPGPALSQNKTQTKIFLYVKSWAPINDWLIWSL